MEKKIVVTVPDRPNLPREMPWTCPACGASGAVTIADPTTEAAWNAIESLVAVGVARVASARGLDPSDRAALVVAHSAKSADCRGEPVIQLSGGKA
ncbi:MAG: hypothetical protein LAO06_02550 [Acidobacteriia bacterium]|nr:hypothetical protein [Terriglobia bacterium]